MSITLLRIAPDAWFDLKARAQAARLGERGLMRISDVLAAGGTGTVETIFMVGSKVGFIMDTGIPKLFKQGESPRDPIKP